MKKLLTIVIIIVIIAIAKADKLREVGEIWPTLTATEKVIAFFAFVLIAVLFFAVGWAMRWGWSKLARRR